MKCTRHTEREAVAQCSRCGAGVCAQCAETTEMTRADCGVLCIDCYCSELNEAVEYYKKNSRKRLIRVIVSIILYLFGWVAIISGLSQSPAIYAMIIVGVVFCGVYTGITWGKAAKESHEEYERKHGATYTVTSSGIYKQNGFWTKVIFFFIGTIFGVVVTPIRVIIDIVAICKNKKNRRVLNEAINEAYAI